ncbi:MAG: hypothetical protein GY782_01685 [Gammaproteobacteria bacterium]|nr:hypothetical protein [Gammaproteobacteria bacterium]
MKIGVKGKSGVIENKLMFENQGESGNIDLSALTASDAIASPNSRINHQENSTGPPA